MELEKHKHLNTKLHICINDKEKKKYIKMAKDLGISISFTVRQMLADYYNTKYKGKK
jgi:hypothetical protein